MPATVTPDSNHTNGAHPAISRVQLLSGNLAHVLTQWMTLIMRDATYLSDNLPAGAATHEHAVRILDTIREIAELTRRLRAVGRLTDPHTLPGVQIVDVGEMARQAVAYISHACRHQKVELNWNPPTPSPRALAEPDILLACMVNLLCNSIDAMPEGGQLILDIKSDRQSVVLRIRDTGHGVAQENLARITEPLYTTRPAHTASAGLGLAIVRSAVNRWGGKFSIRSREGRGVVCRMTLPNAPTRSSTVTAQPRNQPDVILIVEDDAKLRALMLESLRASGFDVHGAATAREGVAMFRRLHSRLKLALVDLILPDRDGKSVINTFAALAPTVGIIILSGFSRDYVRSCVRRGTWGYLQKPFELPQLQAAVRSYMSAHRAGSDSVLSQTAAT